eukprot:81242-Pyramimonas_sp.AAC.1
MGQPVITAQTCARIAGAGCTSADPSKWGNLSSRHRRALALRTKDALLPTRQTGAIFHHGT